TEEIKTRVDAGEKPEKVAAEVIADRRAEKERIRAERAAQQAEFDRHREQTRASLPGNIQRGEEAKARNGSVHAAVTGTSPAARIAELASLNDALNAKVEEQAEYITSLEAEAADLK